MARKRMFDLEVIDTDMFLEMPASTQNLYFHLGMRADDDGFVGNSRKICKIIGATDEDIDILVQNDYLIKFDSGIVVITHWNVNNYLDKNKVKQTTYLKEKNQIIYNELTNKYELYECHEVPEDNKADENLSVAVVEESNQDNQELNENLDEKQELNDGLTNVNQEFNENSTEDNPEFNESLTKVNQKFNESLTEVKPKLNQSLTTEVNQKFNESLTKVKPKFNKGLTKVYQKFNQNSIEENSIDKNRIEKNRKEENIIIIIDKDKDNQSSIDTNINTNTDININTKTEFNNNNNNGVAPQTPLNKNNNTWGCTPNPASASFSQTDQEYLKLMSLMEETINSKQDSNVKECLNYITKDKLSFDVIEYALRKTARTANPTWNYANTVLSDYVKHNLKSLDDVVNYDLSFKNKTSKVPPIGETDKEKLERRLRALTEREARKKEEKENLKNGES